MNLKEVYNQDFFAALNFSLKKFCPNFQEDKFLKLIYDENWQNRELKARMRHICLVLNVILTQDFAQDIEILKKVAANIKPKSPYPSLSLVIFANYVEIFGLDYPDISLLALEFFTEFGSSEFAVRPFFIKYPKETLKAALKWSKSDNYHVRRLASEGLRPRLPWGIALKELQKNPQSIIPILENLKNDESEYVRRSVANNLNDICKDNPDLALELAEKWLKDDSKNIIRLVKHGIRTLLKASNKKALELFDYKSIKNPVELFALKNLEINMGEYLNFSFALSLQNEARIRIEYAIYFLMGNKKFSRKVFQIVQKDFDKGRHFFEKKHSFRKITTRRYYSGLHKIALIINGQEVSCADFSLLNCSNL